VVCFDTSFLVDLVRRRPAAEEKLRQYLENGDPLTTTPISAAELFEGVLSGKSRKGEYERVDGLLRHLELLEFSLTVCEKYGRLVNELRTRGSPIGDLDTLIASAAITHRQILLTRNKTHFEKVPGLAVESW
jgi:tRNA(fMet)-specific endonuclease VapC